MFLAQFVGADAGQVRYSQGQLFQVRDGFRKRAGGADSLASLVAFFLYDIVALEFLPGAYACDTHMFMYPGGWPLNKVQRSVHSHFLEFGGASPAYAPDIVYGG